MPAVHCSTLMIASASSGQGKTSFTATLARAHIKLGRNVAIFKLGPDFLDPMIQWLASQQTCYNLDLWMMGEQHCKELLFNAAENNDLILIESLMGLHDNQPSSAEFAQLFNIPLLLLLDVAKYAQTAAAIVHGLRYYSNPSKTKAEPLTLYGVVGNKVGSDNHHRIINEVLEGCYLGSIKRDELVQLPQRHLGLIQAEELINLEQELNYAADTLINNEYAKKLLQLPPAVEFVHADVKPTTQYYKNKTIAIAKDAAFSFIYPANINYLINNGAMLKYFSPLNNEAVPTADMLWLPGGYPELYLDILEKNTNSKQTITEFCNTEKPVLAECGGLLYLLDLITDKHGNSAAMCGVISGKAKLEKRFQGIGLQEVEIQNQQARGHSFHHSSITTSLKPICYSNKQDGSQGEAIYKVKNVLASYMHFYFPLNDGFQW